MDLAILLKELSEFGAVCGDEFRLSLRLKEVFSEFGHDIIIDNMANMILHVKGSSSGKKLMLFTHMDEPGLVITQIDSQGFLKFKPLGGLIPKDLASQEVMVYGKKTLLGVIGLRPPHILSREEREAPVTQEELNIDVGLSPEKAIKMVKPGDTAVIKRKFIGLQNKKVCGKALSDRAGIAVIYETLKRVPKTKSDIFIALGSQHYNNHMGALVVTNEIKPDVAIVLDAVEAKSREGYGIYQVCGQGPVIYRGPSAHPLFTEWMLDYARDKKIKYQVKAASGKNPTDAWAIQVACGGIPTAIVLNPVKYQKSTVEAMDINDIVGSAELLTGFITHIDDKDWGELLCY